MIDMIRINIEENRVLEFNSLDESIIKEIDKCLKEIPLAIWNKTIIGTVLNYVFNSKNKEITVYYNEYNKILTMRIAKDYNNKLMDICDDIINYIQYKQGMYIIDLIEKNQKNYKNNA